jgi:hypothetical protein
MIDKFIIDPDIEKICEKKAKEEYELAKRIEETWPKKIVDRDFIVISVKEEIQHKRLIVVKSGNAKEFTNPKSELRKTWFALRAKYAEEAVKKVMD